MSDNRGRSRLASCLGIGCLALVWVFSIALILFNALVLTPVIHSNSVVRVVINGSIPEYAVSNPLAQISGPQLTLRAVLDALEFARKDRKIVGVMLRVEPNSLGWASTQEIVSAIQRLEAAGKWTASYMDTAGEFTPGNKSYMLAASCRSVSLNPVGDVNLVGLAARVPFIRGTLDKLGIEPQFDGRKEYKTARYTFTDKDLNPANREMTEWLLDSLTEQLLDAISSERGMDRAKVEAIIAEAPIPAERALELGLVDRLEDWSEFKKRLEEEHGKFHTLGVMEYLSKRKASQGKLRRHKIAVVTAVGPIIRGLGDSGWSEKIYSEEIAKAWRQVAEDKKIEAAVFRINSPGGSAVGSEVIRREVERVAGKIPVVVSMSDVAASGGYWITCGASYVMADPGTLTASIGVFAGHFYAEKFWSDKLGVTFGKVTRAPNAALYSTVDRWDEQQWNEVNQMLDRIYAQFLERVSKARKMTVEEVDAVAGGRVFTGKQALEKGLIDELGGFYDAVHKAMELAGIPEDGRIRLVDFPKRPAWWKTILGKRQEPDIYRLFAKSVGIDGVWSLVPSGPVWMPPIVVE